MVLKKIAGFFQAIVAAFRRMLCILHIVRHRKNSGNLLPLVMDQTSTMTQVDNQPIQSLPSNDYEELESWDTWGKSDISGFSQSTGISQNNIGNHNTHPHRLISTGDSDPEPDIDFFQDMAPEVRRTKKILVRHKEENSHPVGLSSRLAMSAAIPPVIQGTELGQWDESESAWSTEATEDLSWQADTALKNSKYQERMRRQEEQQRKKLQKESDRKQRRDINMTAVKLS